MITTANVRINPPSNKLVTLPGIAESLLGVGTELFAKGCNDEAMSMLDIAFSVINNPSGQAVTAASKHLLIGSGHLLSEEIVSRTKPDETAHIDLYQEDECDVGPRVLMTPAKPTAVDAKDTTLLENVILFNKALVLHTMCRYMEAKKLYQAVLYALRSLLASPTDVPSHLLMELGMRAENNMGFITYCEGDEELSLVSFDASLHFATHLSDISKEYKLEYTDVLSNRCRVAWMRGDISHNLYTSLQELLQIRSSILEWDHPDVAASHFNLAMAEYAGERSTHAIPHLMHYLQLCTSRSKIGKDDLDPVPGLVYLMLIRNEDKEDHMSQELVRGLRTLQDKRQDQGPKSSEVASVLNYIGTLLFHQKDFENALLFFQEELRLEDSLAESSEDISTSVTCNNIGRILQELGNYPDAITFYQRALKAEYGDISELSLAKGSEESCILQSKGRADATSSSSNLYSTVWYNLGLIHDKLGSYDDAIFAFEMSLELRRAMLGPDHPDIACLLYNIGVLRMERQQLSEASKCFREALRVRRIGAAGQLNDRHVVKTLEKLSSLHKAKGNIRGSLEAANEVLAIQEASPDYDGITRIKDSGITLRSIAELHHAVGDLEASLRTASASVQKLRFIVLDPAHSTLDMFEQIANVEQLASSLLLLGSLHHERCEPMQASSVLEEGARILERANVSIPSHSLIGLREVTCMLATSHCAPSA
jgi:tetratricopeptide (TPR) repeat protein